MYTEHYTKMMNTTRNRSEENWIPFLSAFFPTSVDARFDRGVCASSRAVSRRPSITLLVSPVLAASFEMRRCINSYLRDYSSPPHRRAIMPNFAAYRRRVAALALAYLLLRRRRCSFSRRCRCRCRCCRCCRRRRRCRRRCCCCARKLIVFGTELREKNHLLHRNLGIVH